MKASFPHTLLRYLLLGSIVCLVGCNQGNTSSTSEKPLKAVEKRKIQDEGNKPPSDEFWETVKRGTVQDVKDYIEKERVNVNAQDKDGMTALHHAVVSNSNVDVVKYLIEKGADVNAKSNKGLTPFHLEAFRIGLGISRGAGIILLENGADVYAKDSGGQTPLDMIIEVGTAFTNTSLDVIRRLAERGDPKAKEILQRYEK